MILYLYPGILTNIAILRKILIIGLFLFSLLSEVAALSSGKPEKDKFLIGFSQCTTADSWRKTMFMEMQHELIFYPGMELILTDANSNSMKQIEDIRMLVASGIDLLIVSPNESKPLTDIVNEVFKKGIPVIVIDRKIESENYTAFIGANNYNIGEVAGQYAARMLDGKGKILEIWGLKGSSPAKDRHDGFVNEIGRYPDIQIIDQITGEWESDIAFEAMHTFLETGIQADLVFAHNDYMALGAYEAFEKLLGSKNAYIIGVDALPGQEGGIQAVLDSKLDATLLYPTGGNLAISLSWDILNNKPYPKENELNTLVIDPTNALAFKYQTDEIISLHRRIAVSKQTLDIQVKRFYSQRFWLIVALSSLILVILLAILLTRAFRNKAKANAKLEMQTREIIRQNNELIRISTELEEATRAKLIFFTNISHEFRTPLTLIIGPLENILSSQKLTSEQKQQLEMMLRNARRLLRLINQLMDLRKIDNEKMNLKAGQFDIVTFIEEVKQAFQGLADKKNIEFTFRSEIEHLMLYFDMDKMENILFNLLSNAFKFTPESGIIDINLKLCRHKFSGIEKEAVEIEFCDNGPGIQKEHFDRIFERFYQVEPHETSLFPGTGIGLPLTKGLVELHKGEITLESKQGVGTSFFIYFQLGKDHLNTEEISDSTAGFNLIDKGIISGSEDIEPTNQGEGESRIAEDYENKPLLLIVEDNPDVSRFIKSCLMNEYRIMTAANGAEGFERMYMEEPDLIISDVMMPIMDGLEFVKKLKSDIRTCHIPVILLTARTSYDQKIEGLETGADSYIPKPFNEKHLQVRVKSLIESRQKIRRHYQNDPLSTFTSENKISQLDANFLRKCAAIIEKHLTETEYSVEQLSAEVGLSRVHVYRKIKHLTGLSVSEFVRNIKLKKAAVLLRESGKTVAEISYDIGFSSPSYFSKCFKDLFKVTPSEYVQQK
jgi:signal transduction histidine kinase/DNA-binding response OmpR family regulator